MNMKTIKDMHVVSVGQEKPDASAVGYRVVANAMPATQEQAPYLGRTSAAGGCSQDELAARMVALGCQMPVAEIKRVWNGTGAYLMETMPEAPRSFDVGFVRVWPVVGGTFPSADAEFNPSRNALYVAAAPSETVRTALAGGTPSKVADVSGDLAEIANVTWNSVALDTIKNGMPFLIVGTFLTVTVGDESAELELPKELGGGVVPVTLETQVSVDDGLQRITGRLTQTVPACEGAKLIVHTHGADPSSRLLPVASDRLIVLAGDAPVPPTDEPEITRGYSTGHGEGEDDGKVFPGTGFVLEGTNFAGAAVKITYSIAGQPSDVDVDPEDMTVTDTTVTIDPASAALQEAIQATGTLTFTVTTSAGSDTYNAVVME